MAETKGKSKLIIIIIAILLLILIAGAAAFWYFTKNLDAPQTQAQQTQDAPPSDTSPTQTNYMRIGPIYQLDQFIVNLLTQGGRRYVKTTIGLEMTSQNLENELNAKRPALRDTIIKILMSKSQEEISTPRGLEKLAEEIAQRVNAMLTDGKIRNVFIMDLAIQ